MTTDEILQKLRNCEEIVKLATTPVQLFILAANLQLAIQHPENTGEGAAIASIRCTTINITSPER